MGIRSSAFSSPPTPNLVFLLVSDEQFSGELLLQFTDEDSNSIFIIQIPETVFYPCSEVQVSGDKILKGVMKRADLRQQQEMMAEGNLIRAGGMVPSGKQRGKRLLFSPFFVGTSGAYFTRSRYFIKQKHVTTLKQTLTQVIFPIFLFFF